MRWQGRLFCIIAVLGTPVAAENVSVPGVDEILERMRLAERARASALHRYAATRRYVLDTQRTSRYAEMGVRVNYTAPGRKDFEVLWQTGPQFVHSRVFHKLLEAEEQSSASDRGRISPENYDFRFVETAMEQGRHCYVLDIVPKRRGKFLVRGRIWVDADEFAVVKLEGEPIESGSFWVRNTRLVQTYRKMGTFWLLASMHSNSQLRLFGKAELHVDNFDYDINPTTTHTASVRELLPFRH